MLKKLVLELLFPSKCIICANYQTDAKVCSECWGNITFINKPCCAICSAAFEFETEENSICGACIQNRPNYDRAISLMKYDDYSKKIIHKFKYQDQLHILEYLTTLMNNMGKEIIKQADIIAPVPMHKYKLLKRGYNQAALLAMRIAENSNLIYLPQLLIKNKSTIAQADLNKKQRMSNIKGSFVLNSKFSTEIKGKNILIIDDVVTTSATINECAKILKKAQPAKILVLSLAKN